MQVAGHKISAIGAVAAESAAILARPEKLRLVQRPSVSSAVNSLPARVDTSTYMGSGRKCAVRLPDGSEGVVRLPSSNAPIEEGAEMFLEWNVEDGILLEDDGSSDSFTT